MGRNHFWLFGCTLVFVGQAAFAAQLSLKPLGTSGLNQPVYVTAAPNDSSRLFIVERTGAIRVFDRTTNTLLTDPYLTIPVSADGERGLLGLTFDPGFGTTNTRFYVDYTRSNPNVPSETGDIIVARYEATSALSNVASPVNITNLLTLEHTSENNHNGGWIGFRPGEPNNLYISTGDGGGSNDPSGNGQDANALLGKMLRINVSGNGAPTNAVGNPFANEVWAYGLRNAWRNSFDRQTGDFWIADVGQGAFEEVNLLLDGTGAGTNFGWDTHEGPDGNDPNTADPLYFYDHSVGEAITGGYVYRGDAISGLLGKYLFGDYTAGKFFLLTRDGLNISVEDITTQLASSVGRNFQFKLVSFGEDSNGELYVVSIGGDGDPGAIFQIVPEPNSLILAWAGMLVCAFFHRRRRFK